MTFLKFSDACPQCGNAELYEGDGSPCRGCRRVFRSGDAVYFHNVPGELVEFTEEDAERCLREHDCECDCGCIECGGEELEEEDIDHRVKSTLWFVAYKDKRPDGTARRRQSVSLVSPPEGLVHAAFWQEPPVGSGHPAYEEALDAVREVYRANRHRAHHLEMAKRYENDLNKAWKEVRPALDRLLEAKERQCRSSTSDAPMATATSSGHQDPG